MKRFRGQSIAIDRGSKMLFSDFQDGGVMWTGQGPREVRRAVEFARAFSGKPAVQVTISLWDMDQKTNLRADISAEQVTETGFAIVFKTWGDTRVARIRADWLAIGEMASDEDWDVD